MFIKKITKSNKNSDKIYVSYRLVESYSTIKGSRHRTILNLGKLDIPKEKFKLLADNIENILSNQINFFENKNDKYINELAHHYAKLIKIQEKNANKELENYPQKAGPNGSLNELKRWKKLSRVQVGK